MSRVLCLGNNTTDTDNKTTELAHRANSTNQGLITDTDIILNDGYYHTSVYDLSQGQILELLTRFDSLILLNQSIESWTHPDAFYNTIKVVDAAEKILPVNRLINSSNIKFFEELVTSNKSFCIFPFIELLVQNGSTTVCCRSSTPVTTLKDLKNWKTDPNYQLIREKMIAGELLPDHCSVCYKYEAQGIKSARQQETVEWINRLRISSIDELPRDKPSYYEVRPNNSCNLQCRMCNPQHSNLIEKEYIRIGLFDRNIRFEYTDFDIVDVDSNLKKLYVAGGEPTAMVEFYEFMQRCIDRAQTSFEILINTNAAKINDKFLHLCSQFENLQFIVSIDGFEKVNDYTRWLSDWDTIISNTKKLLHNNHRVAFNIVVSIYTISRLDQLLKFLDKEFPNSVMHCVLAEFDNDILSPFNYPDIRSALDNLTSVRNLNCYKNDILLASFIDGMINSTVEVDLEKLKLFFEFNDKLDASRNVRLVDYIPELDKFRQKVLY